MTDTREVITDPFMTYASHLGAVRKPREKKLVVQSQADAPMAPSPMEKAQRERGEQLANYRRARKADHQALLDSDHGAAYSRMLAILKRLPDSSVELVQHLRKGWLDALSAQQKHTVLAMIDARITHVRELDGRAPFDDPMVGAPDNLFLICRNIVKGY